MNQAKPAAVQAVPASFGIGQPLRRREDARFLTGQGRYVDDIVLPRQAYGHVLRSPHAAARITSIDIDAANALPGVLTVVTASDLAAWNVGTLPCAIELNNKDGSPLRVPDYPVLAREHVCYAGQPVAFVVANTRFCAQDAAELIEVGYEPTDPIAATSIADRDGQPLVHREFERNIAFDWHFGDERATQDAFAKAARVVTLDLVNNRVIANPIETRGVNAEWNSQTGSLTLHANTQGGWSIKSYLARLFLHIEQDKVRVVTPDVGGGFGMKTFIYPEHVLCALAARHLGQPVKWTATRIESFLADAHGRDHVTSAQLALDGNGRITALGVATKANMGAYLSEFAPFIPTEGAVKVLTGIYDIPSLSYRVTGIFTHTTPVDAYRGAGRPESIYVIERLVDKAARELGIDGTAFRRANMIPAEAMPYLTATGERYDTGDFPSIMEKALARADAAGFAARKAGSAQDGDLRGFGMCCYIESTMGDEIEFADIRLETDGGVSVAVGTQSNGQGHETAYAQVLAARLGISIDAITVLQGDTDLIAWGGGTGGSRSLTIQAAAINAAADEVIAKARALAAADFEANIGDVLFSQGEFSVTGTDIRTRLAELAARHPGQLDTRQSAELDAWTYPNGCHIAEVGIDGDTGVARLLAYTIVDDFGRVVNPLLVEGQVIGGVVQGIGQALMEEARYDDAAQLVSGSLVDYCMARADDLPGLDFSTVEIPSANNAMGIKGCGEAGTIAAPPVVMNALVDALWQGPGHSVPAIDMPAGPEAIWAAFGR